MRLRVCVCYMFKFGLGRFSVPETQTRGLFLVMLRWCLSDHAIKQTQTAGSAGDERKHAPLARANAESDTTP